MEPILVLNENLKIQQEAKRQVYGNKTAKNDGIRSVVFEQIRTAMR